MRLSIPAGTCFTNSQGLLGGPPEYVAAVTYTIGEVKLSRVNARFHLLGFEGSSGHMYMGGFSITLWAQPE